MRMRLAGVVVLAVGAVFLSVPNGAVGSTTGDIEADRGPIDPTDAGAKGGLVEDIENPSAVVKRAEALLGERYVDTRINGEHTAYVVGVLNLTDQEAPALERQLSGSAPVVFEARTVPVRNVTSVRNAVEQAILKSGTPFSVIGSNPEDGAILVGVPTSEDIEAAARIAADTLPDERRLSEAQGTGIDLVSKSALEPVVRIRVISGEGQLTESPFEAPYRAGKAVGIDIGSSGYNCTTGFFMHKNGKNFGSTAGHCGNSSNGDETYFAGDLKGDVQFNQFDAGAPDNVLADVLLFDLGQGGTRTMYRSSTLNRDVTGKYDLNDFVAGWRTCTRGAAWGDQSCGDLRQNYVDVTIHAEGNTIRNQYCWAWEPANDYGNMLGDSGAPVYRVRPNESIWAAGLHSSIKNLAGGPATDSSCFTGINQVLNQLDANLATQ